MLSQKNTKVAKQQDLIHNMIDIAGTVLRLSKYLYQTFIVYDIYYSYLIDSTTGRFGIMTSQVCVLYKRMSS